MKGRRAEEGEEERESKRKGAYGESNCCVEGTRERERQGNDSALK
jgi:hypothetical protein